MASGESHNVTSGEGGHYARQATGLVRNVSPLTMGLFNYSVMLPSYLLAFSVFWVLGAFPGANLYWAYWLAFLGGAIFIVAFSLYSSAIPRTGGDYTLVSRLLHPVFGIISSTCITTSVTLAIGAFGLAASTVVIGPGLTALGVMQGSARLVSWGDTVQTSDAWKFGLGTAVILLISIVVASGWRVAGRVQNISVVISTVGFAIAAIVLLWRGQSGFISEFNRLAEPFSNNPDTYNSVISAAKEQGVLNKPGTDWGQTFPAIGALAGFLFFGWWSVYIAGEVRRARNITTTYIMMAVLFFVTALLTLYTLLFFHVFGTDFFSAANAVSGSDAWPFAAPPYWVFLTSVASGSTFIAWILVLTFIPGLFLNLIINIAQPVRWFFAFAFDGLFPMGVAGVSRRFGVPTVASVLVFILSEASLAMAVWSTNFNQAISLGMLFTFVATALLSIGAIILPYTRTDFWQGSATTRRIAGLPLISLAGAAALAVSVVGEYVYWHYPGLGVVNTGLFPIWLACIVVFAIALYFGAAAVRRRQGIELSYAYREIPPE